MKHHKPKKITTVVLVSALLTLKRRCLRWGKKKGIVKDNSMTTLASLLLFIILSLSTIARAQESAVRGLVYQSPMAFIPEEFDFFHPNAQPQRTVAHCSSLNCLTLPEAANVQSAPKLGSTSKSDSSRKRLGAGSIAGIPIGLVFASLLGLGIYCVVITRQMNAARAKAAHQLQPHV